MSEPVGLLAGAIGTPHPQATCCFCGSALVVGQVEALRAWLCPVDYLRQIACGLFVTPKGGAKQCLDVPLPSQVLFDECPAKNVLWGGQAGPGKSHGVRKWLYRRSLLVPGHEALLLRENNEQLEKTHLRKMATELPLLGAKLVDRTARFPNGSFIDCGHMADAEAVERYLSTEYGAIVPEEASVYPVDSEGTTPLAELSTRARKVYRDIRGREVRPRFMPVSNPGGSSAPWLLDMFVDHTPDFDKFPKLRPVFNEAGEQIKGYHADQWAYLPARLDDNPYQDPEYEDTLSVLSKWRYEQLRKGDWHVFSGQFFSQWTAGSHVQDLGTPAGVRWFRSMDWGYNAPGCFLWWAVLPDGRLYIRDEWKFQQTDEPDVATHVKRTDATHRIAKVSYTAGDPAVFNKTGATHKNRGFVGLSIGDTLGHYGVPIVGADNDRLNGWKRCHAILRVAPDGDPWLVVHPDCRYLIRSIGSARSDKKDPDDVDTHSDDHALDSFRYGAMSPLVGSVLSGVKAPVTPPVGSPAYYMQRDRQRPGRRFGRVA